jgi:hypothetical protein
MDFAVSGVLSLSPSASVGEAGATTIDFANPLHLGGLCANFEPHTEHSAASGVGAVSGTTGAAAYKHPLIGSRGRYLPPPTQLASLPAFTLGVPSRHSERSTLVVIR